MGSRGPAPREKAAAPEAGMGVVGRSLLPILLLAGWAHGEGEHKLTHEQSLVAPEAVAVDFDDRTTSRFHWLWLRDNCPHESQITANGQRLFETAELVRAHQTNRVAEPTEFSVRDRQSPELH